RTLMSKSSELARTAMRAWRSALRNFCVAAAISACVHCRARHPTPQTARCPRIPQASKPVNLHHKIFSHVQKRRNRSIPRQSTPSRLRLPRRSLRPRLLNRSEEHTSELQSRFDLVCRLLLEKKKKT